MRTTSWQAVAARVLIAFSFGLLSPALSSAVLEFSINEELPLNFVIGNVKTAYFDSLGIDFTDRKFSLFQPTQKHRGLFHVDPRTGVLTVNQRIDRETLCYTEPLCRVSFKVLLQRSIEEMHEVRLQVNILDINDCSPAWQRAGPQIVVEFREDSPPGHTVSIPAAHDPDLGRNGSISYQLDNLGAPFGLQTAREDGQIFMELSRQLDREDRSSYNMTLLAIDDGTPRRTGSIHVLVQVTDVNDNAPQFDRSLFIPNRQIFENESVNSLILTLRATDRDSDSYGRVVFDFAPDLTVGGADRQRQQRLARRHFRVTPDGRVILQRRLDFDTMDTKDIVFLVIARDDSQEPKDRRTSTATVSVLVADRVDEPPSVEVCSPVGTCPGVGSVREGPPTGARVAMVIVRDPDTNDRVSCRVTDNSVESADSSIFELISQSGTSEPRRDGNVNVWTYFLQTKAQLDRERRPRVCFSITCRDSASLPSTGDTFHCVAVSDINDNAPRLKSPLIPIRLKALEEDSDRRPIGRLGDFLVDDDLGVNAQLNYSIDVHSTAPESVAAFSVNSDTGLVTPLVRLDREHRSEYSLKVRVSDCGEPPLSVLVDVHISVQDVNDHAPQFVKLSQDDAGVHMRVAENQRPPVIVGRVRAVDADSTDNGNGNGRVLYRLERSMDSSLFAIDRITGQISTARPLDRELQPRHSLRVLAEDQPQGQPRLTGTCHVTVTVEDVNDNVPVLRLAPPDFPAEFQVTQLEPGHRIGHVLADDADEGNNSKIIYQLLNGNHSDSRFTVHPDTGSVLVNRPLHDLRQSPGDPSRSGLKFQLRIRACDLGSPQLCSKPRDYRVDVPPAQPPHLARPGDTAVDTNRRLANSANDGGATLLGFSNETVIFCLVVTLLVLTVACFAVACLIIRRKTSRAGNSTGRGAAAAAACESAAAMVRPPAAEFDPDSTQSKMIDQQSAYYCPSTGKNFREDDYGAYSTTQQLQPRMHFNKLAHLATVARDSRYFSASPSIDRLVDSDQRQQQQQLHYQTLDTASHHLGQRKGQQQAASHLYYEIDGRRNRPVVLSTPQSRRQSHTLPRNGFSVDGKTAGFPSQQQQQQLPLQQMQHRSPFCPYTEASFV